MKAKYLSFLFLALFSFCALFANDQKDSLVIGTASGYAPFVSLNAQGKLEGFDVDVAKVLSERLGKKLVLKDLGRMPSLFLSLKQKKVDALIWAISITHERSQAINLIHYQGEIEKEMPLLFWKEVPANIANLTDLSKNVLSVETGTSQESILRNFPSLNLKNVDKILDAVMDVRYGKSIAVAVDPSLLANLTEKNPDLRIKWFSLPEELQVKGIGIGVAKENAGLTAQIQKEIQAMKKEGIIRKLEKKWKLIE